MKKAYLLILPICLVLIVVAFFVFGKKANAPTNTDETPTTITPNPLPPETKPTPTKIEPVAGALTRITKKPFGIYITKADSPVQPERFSGYHTGTDFETSPDEANIDVPFFAICEGKILQKRTASGYGGILVQACTLDNQAVTVVYGHVSIKSISKNVGDTYTAGEKIGNLGSSPSETDGERKHLHLGIHNGSTANVAGYVQSQSSLSDWLDWQKL